MSTEDLLEVAISNSLMDEIGRQIEERRLNQELKDVIVASKRKNFLEQLQGLNLIGLEALSKGNLSPEENTLVQSEIQKRIKEKDETIAILKENERLNNIIHQEEQKKILSVSDLEKACRKVISATTSLKEVSRLTILFNTMKKIVLRKFDSLPNSNSEEEDEEDIYGPPE